MAVLDARMIEEKPEDMSIAIAKRRLAEGLLDEDPNQSTIARFGNRFRVILPCRPETIRVQSHAMGSALRTTGHPLHERTSTDLMRQFGLLDESNRPIVTFHVDDGSLAESETGSHYPEDLSVIPFKIVASNAARVLETLHGIHDLEHAYRQIVPDGECCHDLRVPTRSIVMTRGGS